MLLSTINASFQASRVFKDQNSNKVEEIYYKILRYFWMIDLTSRDWEREYQQKGRCRYVGLTSDLLQRNPGVLTSYTEKPEIPGGKSNGSPSFRLKRFG